jgi:DNA-binding PadR family transcriptional regulator
LEKRGLVSSRLVEPEENGGRERRYFKIEEAGIERLKEARRALMDLWEGLAPQLDRR